MTELLRLLADDDLDQSAALGRLAFGGDPAAAVPPRPPGRRVWGVLDGDRLVAQASVLDLSQWWGGRRVPMAGVAGVAVHPDARGRGVGRRLVRHLLDEARDRGQVVSALFPTAPGIYRPLGWELVGQLEQTRLPVGLLRDVRPSAHVEVRTAGRDQVPAVRAAYGARAASGNGLLTRTGPCFPRPEEGVLDTDVVALAVEDGAVAGYVAYDRGRGYGPESELRVRELCASTPDAGRALLAHLAGWDSVVHAVRWRGPTDELALLLGRTLPPPCEAQPWMLRLVDAPAAVAARGFPAGLQLRATFTLVDPELSEHSGAWTLLVEAGAGRLERPSRRVDAPQLHVRGLALLWSSAASTAQVRRAGLLDGPGDALHPLDAAFAGPRPVLLDHF